MEIENQELLQQLKDGKVTIYYRPSYRLPGKLEKLILVLGKAFPKDLKPTGESIYYRRNIQDSGYWAGSNYHDEHTVVTIDDFFKPSEVNINYEIF